MNFLFVLISILVLSPFGNCNASDDVDSFGMSKAIPDKSKIATPQRLILTNDAKNQLQRLAEMLEKNPEIMRFMENLNQRMSGHKKDPDSKEVEILTQTEKAEEPKTLFQKGFSLIKQFFVFMSGMQTKIYIAIMLYRIYSML